MSDKKPSDKETPQKPHYPTPKPNHRDDGKGGEKKHTDPIKPVRPGFN